MYVLFVWPSQGMYSFYLAAIAVFAEIAMKGRKVPNMSARFANRLCKQELKSFFPN